MENINAETLCDRLNSGFEGKIKFSGRISFGLEDDSWFGHRGDFVLEKTSSTEREYHLSPVINGVQERGVNFDLYGNLAYDSRGIAVPVRILDRDARLLIQELAEIKS